MKYILSISFFLILVQYTVGQESIVVQWSSEKEDSAIVSGVESNYIVNADNYVNRDEVYEARFFIKGYENYAGDVEISSTNYETISNNELKSLGDLDFSSKVSSSSSISKARDKFVHSIAVTPIICNGGSCKRLINFQVKRKLSSSRRNKLISKKGLDITRTNSVLQSGEWKKIRIDTTGVFQITSALLQRLGFNPNTTDPNNVRVYGFGGRSLPLANSENRFFDIPEIAVDVIGGGDGIFDSDDKIYFYGIGTKGWNQDNVSFVNPYSDEAFYYITVGSDPSKKILDIVEPIGDAVSVFNSFDYETFFEEDKVNLVRQGREWFGDNIDVELSKSLNFFVPERVNNEVVSYDLNIAGDYNQNPIVTIGSNDNTDSPEVVTLSNIRSSIDYIITGTKGSLGTNTALEDVSVNLTFDKQGDPSSNIYIDNLLLKAECKLKAFGKQFSFKNSNQVSNSGVGQYVIDSAEEITSIWDITDPYNPTKKNHNGSAQATLKVGLGVDKNYQAFVEGDVFDPIVPSSFNVDNQNIKGDIFKNAQGGEEGVDYLIITHESLVPAANRLASLREKDGLRSKILTTESIFNEFSSGQQDIAAIRNVIRYVYANASSEADRLKFVCFLGSPSFDYKDRVVENVNLVPIFHAIEGNSGTRSYPSDDFYVALDEDEGANIVTDAMDVAVGRILASDLSVANEMIDKIVDYNSDKTSGAWRRNITFFADDPDTASDKTRDGQLQVMLDFAANRLRDDIERARVNKLLSDAFEQISTPSGPRYPQVSQSVINSFENGSLMSFYLGHGGVSGLAVEDLFNSRTAVDLSNDTRPNIFVTVTCELTRFDDPLGLSAGELMFLNSRGGSVVLITTVRDIFVSVALNFYPIFVDKLFDENKDPLPIGEALRLAKSELTSFNKRSIFCIGDPALVPGIPSTGISVDSVNDEVNFNEIVNSADGTERSREVLQGLGRVRMKGSLLNADKSGVDESFNGVATVSVFAPREQRTTLANDGFTQRWELNESTFRFTSQDTEEPYKFNFEVPGKLLFSGKASIRKGEYNVTFVMPRNVGEKLAKGEISIYAENQGQGPDKLDVESITIGGLSDEALEDVSPPQIEIFINDESFTDGQLVSSEPLIIAKFSDENGINTAGGVGHDIIAIIDGDEANPIVLNEFYTSEIDDFTKGRIEYRLRDLEEGEHTIEIRVSDTSNNATSKEITFTSANSSDFNINRVLNYPNPFTSKTGFWFSHTGSSSLELEVFVQVFTVTGKIVKSLKTVSPVSGQNTYEGVLMWDGKDDFGKKLGKGTYLYKISVKSPLMNKTVTKIEKLVIL